MTLLAIAVLALAPAAEKYLTARRADCEACGGIDPDCASCELRSAAP